MRTTIDIPDGIYRELKARAAREGTSVKQIILRSVTVEAPAAEGMGAKSPLTYPLIASKQPGSMRLGEEGVYEYIPFP